MAVDLSGIGIAGREVGDEAASPARSQPVEGLLQS